MSLVAGCPRCRPPCPPSTGRRCCPVHGVVSRTLWRPEDDAEILYDVFADHLGTAGNLPDVPALADEPRVVGHRLRGRRRRPGPGHRDVRVGDQRARRSGRRVRGRRGARHRARRTVRRPRRRRPRSRGGGGPADVPGSGSAASPCRCGSCRRRRPTAVRPLGLRRRGQGPVAVAGAPAGLGDAAAARRLDPARRLVRRARPWSSCRSEDPARSGERVCGCASTSTPTRAPPTARRARRR